MRLECVGIPGPRTRTSHGGLLLLRDLLRMAGQADGAAYIIFSIARPGGWPPGNRFDADFGRHRRCRPMGLGLGFRGGQTVAEKKRYAEDSDPATGSVLGQAIRKLDE